MHLGLSRMIDGPFMQRYFFDVHISEFVTSSARMLAKGLMIALFENSFTADSWFNKSATIPRAGIMVDVLKKTATGY